MPESLHELFEAASADLATRTRPPGAQQAIATTRRRTAGLLAAAATAVVVGLTSFALLVVGRVDSSPEPAPAPSPAFPTGLDVGDVPVWYDDQGLHRGDLVEPTALPLTHSTLGDAGLTLVRTGALYQSQASTDIWFHPWGGEPRVVGQAALTGGPWNGAGDPSGDLGAWFEGDELVVYDTFAGREVARVATEPAAEFVLVSTGSVVWRPLNSRSGPLLELDLATQQVTELEASRQVDQETPYLVDLRAGAELWAYGSSEILLVSGDADGGGLIVRSPGQDERRYPAFVSPAGWLSPDGRFLGGWTGDEERPRFGGISGAGFVEVSSGEFLELPGGAPHGQGVAWTYGSTAMVPTVTGGDGGPDQLFACDVAARSCDRIATEGAVLLPS